MRHLFAILLAVGCCMSVIACSRTADEAPPIATPTVTLNRSDAAVGSPIEMTYTFTVAPGMMPLTDDYLLFVHFVDKDGELLWADDHQPETPIRQWKAGQVIRYTRTMFVPKVPYTGQTNVDVGIYSPKTGMRLPMTGQDAGMHAYRVAKLNLRLQNERDVVVFKSGWHDTEVAPGGLEWQWSRKDGMLSFPNPKRDVVLLLEADQPVKLPQPQVVTLRIGSTTVDMFPVPTASRVLRRTDIGAAQLGSSDTVELTVDVDQTFVPATMPELKSHDTRVLGVRVFRAYVQPK